MRDKSRTETYFPILLLDQINLLCATVMNWGPPQSFCAFRFEMQKARLMYERGIQCMAARHCDGVRLTVDNADTVVRMAYTAMGPELGWSIP